MCMQHNPVYKSGINLDFLSAAAVKGFFKQLLTLNTKRQGKGEYEQYQCPGHTKKQLVVFGAEKQ